VKVETIGNQHVFEVEVYLNDIDPHTVRVEIYADGVNGGSRVCQEMTPGRQLSGTVHGYVYNASVALTRPTTDYTARVLPYFPGVAVPLEAALILWQR